MDGPRKTQQQWQSADATVEERVQGIKQHMPETYKAIQAKAEEIGREAYAFVRRGVAGQPNMFYAVERGFVVGTPFTLADLNAEVAKNMVMFGVKFLIMWGLPASGEVSHGAH